MAVYKSTNTASSIASVEFSPVSGGNFTFFNLNKPEGKDALKQWLTSPEVGQEIVAETIVEGKPMLVTHGDKTQDQLRALLDARGEKLAPYRPKKGINVWAWRGHMSNMGQVLQIMSAAMGPKGIETSTMTFGLSNLAANMTNLMFGGEEHRDEHGERYLKTKIRDNLSSHVTGKNPLPGVDEPLAELRKDQEPPPSPGQKINGFLKRHSVKIGEIGLRYFGAANMVVPLFDLGKAHEINGVKTGLTRWAAASQAISKGQFGKAFKTVRSSGANLYVGVAYLIGKSLAFFSKVPDPYDPKPRSAFDEFREKYVFRISTVIEAIGAGTLAASRLRREKDTATGDWKVKSTPGKVFDKVGTKYGKTGWERDYLGGTGGLLFMGGFGFRYFAPFGVMKMNMDEVYAHAEEALARTPPEKLPQLLAETSATLKEHLKDKDKDITYSEIFTKMMTDLYQYHHISLGKTGTGSESLPKAQTARNLPQSRNPLERVSIPADSHAEGITKPDDPSLSLGAR